MKKPCGSALGSRQRAELKRLEDFVSESWEDLKETIGEYLEDSAVTVIGNWRKVDAGYEVAEILTVFLPMVIYTIENIMNWIGADVDFRKECQMIYFRHMV